MVRLVIHLEIDLCWQGFPVEDFLRTVFALELHHDPECIFDLPFFLGEQRLKTIWFVCLLDQGLAMFFGRPSTIDRKLYSIQSKFEGQGLH